MEYNQNIITESRAVIFINTSCNKTKNLSKEDQNTVLIQTLSNKIRRNDPDVQHLISENRASQFPKQTRKIIEKLSEKQRLDYLNEIFRIPWNNAYERGQGMSEFFTRTMHFDEANVKKCINYSKNQIIQELDRLRALAYNFDRNLKEGQAQENLAICVVWVGPSINSEVKLHRKLLNELKVENPDPREIDQTEYTQVYELTHLGEIICINEYMKHIAEPPSVRVIQLNDK